MKSVFLLWTLFSALAYGQVNTRAYCEAFHYSVCPKICTSTCIGSCPLCQDCDGKGSCTYRGKSEAAFDINYQDPRNLQRTALMEALVSGATRAKIQKLLDLGASLRIKDREGNTPLLLARIDAKNLDVIKLLLDRGADIKARNVMGQGIANKFTCYDPQIYSFLKRKGASLSDVSSLGNAISACIRQCNVDAIKYLKEQGVPTPKDWKTLAQQSKCAKAAAVL